MSSTPPLDAFQDDRQHMRTTIFGMLRRMWPYFMGHRLMFAASLVTVLIVAVLGRLSVTLFGYAIDHGLIEKNRQIVIWVAIAYFAIEISRCYLTYLQGYLFSKVGNRILFEIRDQLIRHVQALPIAFFDRNPTGRIVTRVTTDVISLGEMFTQALINMFSAFVSLIVIVVAMAAISARLTIATLVIAPPLLWLISKISRRLMDVLRESKTKIAAINAFFAENVSGMRVLQLHDRLDRNVTRFRNMSHEYRDQQMKTVQLYAMLWPLVSFFNAASVGVALYFGGRLVLGGNVTTGAMIAFLLHVRAFVDPLNQILERYQTLQTSQSGAERIFTIFEEATEKLSPVRARALAPEDRFRGDIKFENLCFRYGEKLPFALHEVNLSVQAGESIALVGRTGSGKSTMIALLQRFYDPTSGTILVDGKSIIDIDKSFLRSRIGVVQQDTFLFRGTIAENISLGDGSITRERIEYAAHMACLTEVITKRAGGLDAKVEERGANLSVGERQLIAFARILAFDPDILILDEATSNIDSKTENLIQEATRTVRKGRTSFIIAHRISTIVDCDRIVVIDHSRIQETGTHESLLLENGIYAALYKAQVKNPQLFQDSAHSEKVTRPTV